MSSSGSPPKKCRLAEKPTKVLDDVPEEIILMIGNYLDSKSVLNFSHANNRIFRIFNADESIWKRLKTEINVPSCERIDHLANQLVSKNTVCRNPSKLEYLMLKRTENNWSTGQCRFVEMAEAVIVRVTEQNVVSVCVDKDQRIFLQIMDMYSKQTRKINWIAKGWSQESTVTKQILKIENLVVEGTIACLHVSLGFSYVVSALDFGSRLRNGKKIWEYSSNPWTRVELGENGRVYFFHWISLAGCIVVLDLKTGAKLKSFESPRISCTGCMAITNDWIVVPQAITMDSIVNEGVRLAAINYPQEKTKTLQRTSTKVTEWMDIQIKNGIVYAISCKSSLNAVIWDLETGNILSSTKCSPGDCFDWSHVKRMKGLKQDGFSITILSEDDRSQILTYSVGSSREEVQQGFRLDKNKSCQLSSTNNKDTVCGIVNNHLVRVTTAPNRFHFLVVPFDDNGGKRVVRRYEIPHFHRYNLDKEKSGSDFPHLTLWANSTVLVVEMDHRKIFVFDLAPDVD